MFHTRRASATIAAVTGLALTFGTVSASAEPSGSTEGVVAPQSSDAEFARSDAPWRQLPSDASRVSRQGVSASAIPEDAAVIDSINIEDGILYAKNEPLVNAIDGVVGLTLKPGYVLDSDDLHDVYAEITVNDELYDLIVPLYPDGVVIPNEVGPGTVRVVRSHIWVENEAGTERAKLINDISDTFKFRRDTFGHIKIKRVNSKRAFRTKAVLRKNNGDTLSAEKAKVQFKKGGGWKLLKKVKLNKKGKGKFSISTSKKRKYRLLVPQTKTVQGMKITLKRKI